MTDFVFANFIETELLDNISTDATIIHIAPSQAAKLTLFTTNELEARFVLWDGVNMPEIVGVIENPQTGYLIVNRAQEGTSSRPWAAGTQVICSLTAEMINAALQSQFDINVLLDANFLKLAGGTLLGPLTLAGDPTSPLHAVTKQYADSIPGSKLPLAGGTMLGNINMNGFRLLNLPAAVAINEPVRKIEFDAANAAQSNINSTRAGALTSGGTSTAFTVGTPIPFASLGAMANQVVAFVPFITNGQTVTLSVDGLTAKPLRASPGKELPPGVLIQGTPYLCTYNSADGVFYLQDFYGNPYNIPLGGGMDFWGNAVPNSSFAFAMGQGLSTTTYADLFGIMGYAHGGAGAVFNLPDKSGKASVGREAAATLLTPTYFGGNSTVIGAVGGNEKHTLTAGEIPSITSRNATQAISVNSSLTDIVRRAAATAYTPVAAPGSGAYGFNTNSPSDTAVASSGNNDVNVTSNNTGGNPHTVIQPSIVCNYIIRVL